MVAIDLDEDDVEILSRLGPGGTRPARLASTLDEPEDALADRLADLADNGLVREDADGRYARTKSGRRALDAPATGGADERIDTPADVERALESLELRADAAAAVRNAFTLLRNRGRASRAEVTALVFSEVPAGYDDPEEWWTDLVRDALLALPDVTDVPDGDELRYEREPAHDVAR